MRRQTHLVIGGLAFLAYSYPLVLILALPAGSILLGLFAAFFGSVMPDVLEPARDWAHRGFCHSRRVMKFTAEIFAVTALVGLFQMFIHDLFLVYLASGFFLGYAVHLLADSTTPAGLPE
jgi:membrane-bound metal-dependent hydrolase YbcI (DUF457 family)